MPTSAHVRSEGDVASRLSQAASTSRHGFALPTTVSHSMLEALLETVFRTPDGPASYGGKLVSAANIQPLLPRQNALNVVWQNVHAHSFVQSACINDE